MPGHPDWSGLEVTGEDNLVERAGVLLKVVTRENRFVHLPAPSERPRILEQWLELPRAAADTFSQ